MRPHASLAAGVRKAGRSWVMLMHRNILPAASRAWQAIGTESPVDRQRLRVLSSLCASLAWALPGGLTSVDKLHLDFTFAPTPTRI
jgi:hypothetical protein